MRYSIGTGSRKCSKAEVILREGTGQFLINGDPNGIDFFDGVLERFQLLSPFAFLGRIGEFDVEAEVQGELSAASFWILKQNGGDFDKMYPSLEWLYHLLSQPKL